MSSPTAAACTSKWALVMAGTGSGPSSSSSSSSSRPCSSLILARSSAWKVMSISCLTLSLMAFIAARWQISAQIVFVLNDRAFKGAGLVL